MRRIGILGLVLLAFVLVLGLAGFIGQAEPVAASQAVPAAVDAQTAPQAAPQLVAQAAPQAVDTPAALDASAASDAPNAPDADLLESSGKLSFLRVHDVGTGYGPASDFLDVEVVAKLSNLPAKSFGFQLRADSNQAARQGMLDLLRDAFNNNWTVIIDYYIDPGKNNGRIIRVALQK
jgi:hypothetical protein